MSKELAKTYDPNGLEDRLYKKWEENGYFHAEVDRSKKPFTIVMPPPNITGQLHMGHALDNTMQDILIRYKRMQGYNALWQPGTDHAAIATEVKVIEHLKEQLIEYQEDMASPGFWDDVERAQKVNQKMRSCENRINHYKSLQSRADDVEVMMELAEEEGGDEMAGEIGEELKKLREDFITAQTIELVDPLNIRKAIAALEEQISTFLVEVDAALSVSNAITEIEIAY